MLLIIEDKDDPTEPVAEETEGGSELLYIPVVTVRVTEDAEALQCSCTLGRMLFDLRSDTDAEQLEPQNAGKLLPLFLRTLDHTGRRPEYVTAAASCIGEDGTKFSARG